MKRVLDKIVLGLFMLVPAAILLSFLAAIIVFAYLAYLDWYKCYKLELIAEDGKQSAYLLAWASKLANDQDYLASLGEYRGSLQRRTLEDFNYSHSSIVDFDWQALGLTHAIIPHSLTLTDLDNDGRIDVVLFPSGRDRIGVILDKKLKLEDFVSADSMKEYTSVNETFFVYCDDGSY